MKPKSKNSKVIKGETKNRLRQKAVSGLFLYHPSIPRMIFTVRDFFKSYGFNFWKLIDKISDNFFLRVFSKE